MRFRSLEERMGGCELRGARRLRDASEGAWGLVLTIHGVMIPEHDLVDQWAIFCSPTRGLFRIYLAPGNGFFL